MEQKDYKLEITALLLQGKNHIRGLAQKLKTNHMLVARKIRELAKSNVADFAWEGKNKSYFLKATAEARLYSIMAENYKLLQILGRYPRLRGIIEKIQKDKRITLAILFGSYAKSLAMKESDIDVYIETRNRSIKKELQLLDSKLSIKIGKYDRKNPLIQEIEKNHVIIKGVEDYYEKNQFFG
jgi:predicted nucleotidyltransferase